MARHPEYDTTDGSLAGGLYGAAHWIWNARRAAKRTGFPFSEESITETVLLDLASSMANNVHIIPFTKIEEGKVGADWEWCFYDLENNRYLRFLIQAKLLDKLDKNYSHIDRYIGDTGTRQIDRLAQTSISRGVPAYYVFYNHLDDTSRVPADHCSCHGCVYCWGASIAPLDAVRGSLPDKSFDTLRHFSMPWLCLLCANNAAGGDPIAGALSGMARLDTFSRKWAPKAQRSDLPDLRQEPESERPSYLDFLLEYEAGKVAAPTWTEGRALAREFPGLDGVALVDASPTAVKARRRLRKS